MQERIVGLPSGVKTTVLEAGDGPCVLLLHGNPDNADEWQQVIGKLSAHCRCLAPDLPGYGSRARIRPLPESFQYTVDAQVEFLDEFLRSLQVESVTLVVHDIGGIMGVPWAARNAHRLRGVLYTNTVAFPGFHWFPTARLWGSPALGARLRSGLMMRALGLRGGAVFRRAFGRQNPQLSEWDLQRFAQEFAMNPIAKATTLRQFRLITEPSYFDGYDEMLRSIARATRTCTVWGMGDPYVPDERADDLLAEDIVRLEGVGHWVPLLAADEVSRQVQKLVANPEPGATRSG